MKIILFNEFYNLQPVLSVIIRCAYPNKNTFNPFTLKLYQLEATRIEAIEPNSPKIRAQHVGISKEHLTELLLHVIFFCELFDFCFSFRKLDLQTSYNHVNLKCKALLRKLLQFTLEAKLQ